MLLIVAVDLRFGVRVLFCHCLFRLFLVVWVWCICLKMLVLLWFVDLLVW